MRKKKWMSILLLTTCSILLFGCGQAGKESAEKKSTEKETIENSQAVEEVEEEQTAEEEASEEQLAADPIGIHHAEITVENYGTITVELDGDTAPISVQNFMDLAKEGFYDGLTFHRIIDGFMIQGGDPSGDGTGGAEHTIKGEFSSNGVKNDISHHTGVISMARAYDPDSASSQFFIMVADAEYLDGEYAAFGHVTDGLDLVLQIAKDAEPIDGNGTIPKEKQPVITSIVITD